MRSNNPDAFTTVPPVSPRPADVGDPCRCDFDCGATTWDRDVNERWICEDCREEHFPNRDCYCPICNGMRSDKAKDRDGGGS